MGRSYVTDALAEGAETAKRACLVCGSVGGAGTAVVVLVPVWDSVIAGVLAQAVKSGRRPTVILREAAGKARLSTLTCALHTDCSRKHRVAASTSY